MPAQRRKVKTKKPMLNYLVPKMTDMEKKMRFKRERNQRVRSLSERTGRKMKESITDGAEYEEGDNVNDKMMITWTGIQGQRVRWEIQSWDDYRGNWETIDQGQTRDHTRAINEVEKALNYVF